MLHLCETISAVSLPRGIHMSCVKGGICEHGGCSDCLGEPNIKLGQDWKRMSDASEVKRYKTSPGWYEINDVTEYNGASVRLKPSYTSSTEFKANLEDKQKEVSNDIFRQRDNMSDASEVKRPRIFHVNKDAYGSYQRAILVEDHDRIMAERDELWKRAAKFVMPGEMDTGESIEHYIKTLERTIAELRAEVEKAQSIAWDRKCKAREHELTIATQERVIEKLKAALEWYANATEFEISGDETGEPLADGVPFTTVAKSILKEIEREGEVEK